MRFDIFNFNFYYYRDLNSVTLIVEEFFFEPLSKWPEYVQILRIFLKEKKLHLNYAKLKNNTYNNELSVEILIRDKKNDKHYKINILKSPSLYSNFKIKWDLSVL